MKKQRLYIALILAVLLCVFAFSTCGGSLRGTYNVVDEYTKNSFGWSTPVAVKRLYFQGSRVTITDIGFLVECEYEIKDGRFIAVGSATVMGSPLAVDYDFEFKQEGDSIFLDGVEYVKAD